MAMRSWLASDEAVIGGMLARRLRHFAVPLADRLPAQLAGHAADAARALLEALAADWAYPEVALIGASARAVWSTARVRRSGVDIQLAPIRNREAAASLARMGASPQDGGEIFDWRGLTVRLGSEPAPSIVLVRWRTGRLARGLAVARPEGPPGGLADRHAVRAALQFASRDGRGRRYPPYHEAIGVAKWPLWFELG